MDALMIVGLGLSVGGFVLLIRHYLRLARNVREHKVSTTTAFGALGAGQDWSGALLWFGIWLVQFSNIVDEIRRHAAVDRIMFSLAAGAAITFACGAFVGRLTLRVQQRREANQAS